MFRGPCFAGRAPSSGSPTDRAIAGHSCKGRGAETRRSEQVSGVRLRLVS